MDIQDSNGTKAYQIEKCIISYTEHWTVYNVGLVIGV
jgi:hypothetical protein